MKNTKTDRVWISDGEIPKYCESRNIDTSPPEDVVIACLKKCGIEYLREVYFEGLINHLTGNPLRCDFYLPKERKIIEFESQIQIVYSF